MSMSKSMSMMSSSASARSSGKKDNEHLNVKVLGYSSVRLPYGPNEGNMLFCEYLRDVLYVHLSQDIYGNGMITPPVVLLDDGATVGGCLFMYNQPEVLVVPDEDDKVEKIASKQYSFNYANRRLKMSDVIPGGSDTDPWCA